MGITEDLLTWVRADKPFGYEQLPIYELLTRMVTRVQNGEDERELIVKALAALETVEGRITVNTVEYRTRNRRELKKYFEAAIKQAAEDRDALRLDDLLERQDLINNPPHTGRTIDQATIDLAVNYFKARKHNPLLTYRQHAQNLVGDDPNRIRDEADRIKTTVSRFKKFVEGLPTNQELVLGKSKATTKRAKKTERKKDMRRNVTSDT